MYSMFMTLFIVLQSLLAVLMALHDWIDIPPITDIQALRRHHSTKERFVTSLINAVLVLIPLFLTIWYYNVGFSLAALWTVVSIYGVLTLGTLCAWWIPYLFGSSQAHKKGFIEYHKTHSFLPKRGDNVVPNTLHVVLNILVWSCWGLSLFFLRHV